MLNDFIYLFGFIIRTARVKILIFESVKLSNKDGYKMTEYNVKYRTIKSFSRVTARINTCIQLPKNGLSSLDLFRQLKSYWYEYSLKTLNRKLLSFSFRDQN